MASVTLEGVRKRFGDVTVLDQFDLSVGDGEFVVLLGPSGCGKSTVLRLIAGLDAPTAGTVAIDGRDVGGLRPDERDIAMVFQNYALYPHMTVRTNIEFPLVCHGVPRRKRHEMVATAAATVGVDHLMDRRPDQLSGGQRQRVALARSLVREPAVFLLDEPLSNLDAKLRAQTREHIVELHRRTGATIIYVTHDQVEAMTMADRIGVIDQGRVQQIDEPQRVYDHPASIFVARFLGSPPMNCVPGELLGLGVAADGGDVPPIVGFRPEHVERDDDADLRATVDGVELLGADELLLCHFDDGSHFVVREPSVPRPPRSGDRIGIRVDRDELHLFDPRTGDAVAAS